MFSQKKQACKDNDTVVNNSNMAQAIIFYLNALHSMQCRGYINKVMDLKSSSFNLS